MSPKKFCAFVEIYLTLEDQDHEVEMRWHHSVDGSTKWHTLFEEPSIARYGLFPYDADYKINKKKHGE